MPLRIRNGARALAAACLLVAVAGCAKVPLIGGSERVRVTLTGARDLNSCGKAGGYPLTYRVLQVTDASVLTGMDLTQLWNKEEKLLGPALVDKTEGFLDPGQSKTLAVPRAPKAAAFVVVGNFCRSNGACWYYAQPFSKGGSIKLVAGSSCFAAHR